MTLRETYWEDGIDAVIDAAEGAPCPWCHGTGVLWAQVGRESLVYFSPDYPTHKLLIPLECRQPHWEPKQCPHLGVEEWSPPYGEEQTP